MAHFDAALTTMLTKRTGSPTGTLELYDLPDAQQREHFGRVLTTWRRNAFVINGAEKTVTVLAFHRMFGQVTHDAPKVVTFQELEA